MITYPSTKTAESIIKIQLEITGTNPTFLNKSNFMFILESVRDVSTNPADEHTTIINKAAYLFAKTIELHPMADGNKRVAILLTELFLRANDRQITATSDEIFEKTIGLAKGTLKENDIRNWLEHIVRQIGTDT